MRMKDERKNTKIPTAVIAQVVVEMVLRGQNSLLEVDGQMRHSEYLGWHRSRRRMVVSDTTLFRSLEGFALEPVRAALWAQARQMLDQPHRRACLPSGRRSRLALLDGSGWGGFLGSVLTLRGDMMDVVAGYRMSPGRGHELATSRSLMREAVRELGVGFVDHLAVDGLYMSEPDFQRAHSQNVAPFFATHS